MEAFVQVNKDGEFDNVNFFQAAKGFYDLGYYVNKFTPNDLSKITKETPVFAGIGTFHKVMSHLGIHHKRIETYPQVLSKHLHRLVTETTMDAFRSVVGNRCAMTGKLNPKLFIKPIGNVEKEFPGQLIEKVDNLRDTLTIPSDSKIYMSTEIKFLSEYRVYVKENKIEWISFYKGDKWVQLDISTAQTMIKAYSSCAPIAYGLDVGVITRDTIYKDYPTALVEINDATSLGNYGIPAVPYAKMIITRWEQICGIEPKSL